MRSIALMLAGLLALAAPGAGAVVISFADPVGDHTGVIDVTGLTLDFDDATGVYSIGVTADGSNPFTGEFRVNVNLFNATRNEFFQDGFNDFDLGIATQTLVELSGTSALIEDWLPGDEIAASSFDGLGNPAGVTFFRTSVASLPFGSACAAEDVIGTSGCIEPVSEPASLAIALAGALVVVALPRARRARGPASVSG